MQNRTVMEIATTHITSVSRESSVTQAAQLMMDNNLRNVLIVDDGVKEYGILTVSDLAKLVAKKVDFHTQIKNLKYHIVKQVPHDLSILEASFLIREDLGYLCVVDEQKKLLGIVSMTNIVSCIDSDMVTGNIRLGHIIGKTKAKTARPTETLEEIFSKVNHTVTEAVIICDSHHRCEGIITKRDLLKLIMEKVDMSTQVAQVMKSPLVTVDEECTVKEALELMNTKRFKRIVVVEKSGELMGILTREEMMDIVYNKWSQIVREKDRELKELNSALNEINTQNEYTLKLLGDVMDSTEDFIFYKDLEYRYLGCNIAFSKFVGKPVEQIIGRTDFDLFDDYYSDIFRKTDEHVMETKTKVSNCYWAKVGDNQAVFLSVKKSPLMDKDGVIQGIIGISRDITEQKNLEDSLTQQHKYVQAILDMQEQMIFITNDGRKVYEANKRFLDFFGVNSTDEFHQKHGCFCDFFVKKASYTLNKKGKKWLQYSLQHPKSDHKLLLANSTKIAALQPEEAVKCDKCNSFLVRIEKFHDVESYLISLTNITSIEQESKNLEHMAMTDQLTKIYNRLKFGNLLEAEIAKAKKSKKPLSLIMLDIDHFKKINDTYGHQTGDYALVTTVEIIKDHIRTADIFARWGGEEFMILLPGATIEAAKTKAEILRSAMDEYDYIEPSNVTGSFGVVQLADSDTVDSLTKRVDEALYAAKNAGRNKVVAK